MRIGIDAHAIGSRLGGNETYISGLLAALLEADSRHQIIPFFENEDILREWNNRYPGLEGYAFSHHNRWFRLGFELAAMSRKHNIDLLHVQYSGPLVNAVPLVTTVHDTTYRIYPQFFPLAERTFLRWSVGRSVRSATRVLTVSEASKRDIQRYRGVSKGKVAVTYNGYDSELFHSTRDLVREQELLDQLSVGGPYVLTVGNLQPRKNLITLVQAFEKLVHDMPSLPHQLVIVGKAAFRHSILFREVDQSVIQSRIVFTGYVPDADLPHLYRGAEAFAYPSLYEGFGLPVVEAMACGAPVVTTTGGALPEISGDAAIIVEPENIQEMASALGRLLTDESLAYSLRESGENRAAQFSWQCTARETLKVYDSLNV